MAIDLNKNETGKQLKDTGRTVASIMDNRDRADIRSFRTGEVVRRLRLVNPEEIEIDFLTEKARVPRDTPVYYEPWFMDRGSFLIEVPGFGLAKLCTEADVIDFLDGTQAEILMP